MPLPWFGTHRRLPSGDTRSRCGFLPTGMAAPAVRVAVSIGCTVPSPWFDTQTVLPSGVAATSAGVAPTATVATTAPAAVSMTLTDRESLLAT